LFYQGAKKASSKRQFFRLAYKKLASNYLELLNLIEPWKSRLGYERGDQSLTGKFSGRDKWESISPDLKEEI